MSGITWIDSACGKIIFRKLGQNIPLEPLPVKPNRINEIFIRQTATCHPDADPFPAFFGMFFEGVLIADQVLQSLFQIHG